MAKSNLYLNWSDVNVTPSGSSAINLSTVLDISIDGQSTLETFFGDARKFARLSVATARRRSVTITLGDTAQALAIPEGVPCTISAKLRDALNGTGEGCLTFTMANAMLNRKPINGKNNKYAENSLTFECYGTALDADPISFVEAPGS